jgi:uncharacterized phage protein (TIGR01671 family)
MSNDRFNFRVWDSLINEYRKEGTIQLSGNGQPFIIDGNMQPQDIDKVIIEQCTGLTDKNGKLIYEGDVVLALESWSDRKREFNVIYCDKEYGFLFVDGFKNTKALFAFLPGELEIIGNIHEMEREND